MPFRKRRGRFGGRGSCLARGHQEARQAFLNDIIHIGAVEAHLVADLESQPRPKLLEILSGKMFIRTRQQSPIGTCEDFVAHRMRYRNIRYSLE